jgi:hypothetical protein
MRGVGQASSCSHIDRNEVTAAVLLDEVRQRRTTDSALSRPTDESVALANLYQLGTCADEGDYCSERGPTGASVAFVEVQDRVFQRGRNTGEGRQAVQPELLVSRL